MAPGIYNNTGYGDAWLVLTGGGHIDFGSGLETVINAGKQRGKRILASADGWQGISSSPPHVFDITDYPTENLQYHGGSFMGSSRTKPNDIGSVIENLRPYGKVVVIVHGGDDTLGIAKDVNKEGIPVVGWPKTMDNDTQGSHATIGYLTAVRRAAQGTREAFDTAYTHSRIVLIPMFGRKFDWITGGAADYGFADYVICAERKDIHLEQHAWGIQKKVYGNKANFGRPFAVVAVSESVDDLEGLQPYLIRHLPQGIKQDAFRQTKFEAEASSLALKEGLSDHSDLKFDRFASKILTYHLRDGKLDSLDRQFAIKAAEECVRLIDSENFGLVATVQHPQHSSNWPTEEFWMNDANNGHLFVSNVPLEMAARRKPVMGTPFFDYDNLMPTEAMSSYLATLLGPKPVNPREKIGVAKLATPVMIDLGKSSEQTT